MKLIILFSMIILNISANVQNPGQGPDSIPNERRDSLHVRIADSTKVDPNHKSRRDSVRIDDKDPHK